MSERILIGDTEPNSPEELLTLKPLLTLPGSVPAGWKNAVYGWDGAGSASADNDW